MSVLETRECLYCLESFLPSRKDKKCCSARCSTRHSARNKNRTKREKIKSDGTKKCLSCGKYKDLSQFYKSTRSVYAHCIYCIRVRKQISNKFLEKKDDTYIKVEDFLMYMKRKHFYADAIDIYRLIDIYDLVYPNALTVPYVNDLEKSFMVMFDKVARWFSIQRMRLEKS